MGAVVKYFGAIAMVIIVVWIIAGAIGIATKCEHDIGTEYYFFSPDDLGYGHVRAYCQICDEKWQYYPIHGVL